MTQYQKIMIGIIALIVVGSVLNIYVFPATYDVVAEYPLGAERGVFSRIEIMGDDEWQSFTVYCVKLLPGKSKAIIIDQPHSDQKESRQIKTLARDYNAAVVINGGYFTTDFQPDGLYIMAGKETATLSDKPALSGIVAIDANGEIDLLQRDSDVSAARYAIQAGPFIVDPGGQPGIHSESFKRAARTVIAKSGDGSTLIMLADNATLFELSGLMTETPDAFGVDQIDRALNLDGGPSASLHVTAQGANLTINPTPKVRNYIVVR